MPATRRVRIWYSAWLAALGTTGSEAQWKTSEPGRIATSTPGKPSASAATRVGVVRSPSIGQARIATISGAVRLIAAALAMGMKVMA